MICCICSEEIGDMINDDGEVYWSTGHNASPVKAGRCCTTCNIRIVIPERLEGILDMDRERQEIDRRELEVKHG